jgi:hypothetical protein
VILSSPSPPLDFLRHTRIRVLFSLFSTPPLSFIYRTGLLSQACRTTLICNWVSLCIQAHNYYIFPPPQQHTSPTPVYIISHPSAIQYLTIADLLNTLFAFGFNPKYIQPFLYSNPNKPLDDVRTPHALNEHYNVFLAACVTQSRSVEALSPIHQLRKRL